MQPGDTKLRRLEARHPGLIRSIDAMLDAFATVKAVAAMVRANYGEFVAVSTIGNYRCRIWKVRRDCELAIRARQAAWQIFVGERRS